MRNQAYFLQKIVKKLKCRLVQFLFGTLRVNRISTIQLLHIVINKSISGANSRIGSD